MSQLDFYPLEYKDWNVNPFVFLILNIKSHIQ